MGFADSGRPEQRGARPGLDEGQSGEVFDLAWVKVGLEGKVAIIECFMVRQPGEPQALAEVAVVPDGEFLGEEQVEEVEIAELTLVRASVELADSFRQMGQAELCGGGADAVAGQLAYDESFGVRWVVKGRVPVSSS
ncbi:hypothetical protein GCM10010245_87780 [Streptomyces spectabilis]|uniref:Uncharacterized protein n=1 Tax=Streptomyces spectabilis TaxID=68270 RepID=A0A7W8F0H2_STRST|nr:hypothetical protein [Streptomyces spectabilis]GGV55406.1 hypothetical protein GCM10010245_87780 [Streptomyces spectabilis]